MKRISINSKLLPAELIDLKYIKIKERKSLIISPNCHDDYLIFDYNSRYSKCIYYIEYKII